MQETADLVTFTEQILNGKLHFWCSVRAFMPAKRFLLTLMISMHRGVNIDYR